MTHEPLVLLEVDVSRVGSPTNDGQRGSGLYLVPIKLNRVPTARESRLLAKHWDSPPQYTSMHRPGILRVAGSYLELTKTTVEEVAKYHAATLKLVVQATNAEEVRAVQEERRAAEEKAAAEAAHREDVACRAKDIKF